nr:dihydrofolate reductase family protein [Agromyces tardus]
MGILTVEQIVSADGYAADASGGIDFFTAVDEPAATDAEQLEWLTGVDAILLGGNTYRMFAGYWPGADPAVEPVAEVIARLPKYVFSNAIDHAPWGDDALEVLHGDVATSIAELKGRHASIVVWAASCSATSCSARVSSTTCTCASCPCSSARAGRSPRPTSASSASRSTTPCRTRAGTWACTTGCAELSRACG